VLNLLFRQVRRIKKLPGAERLVLWAMRQYEEGSVATLRFGLAKGCRWKRSHRQPNSFWLGYYEIENQLAMQRHLRPGDVFYDLGANAGFFSLVAATLVGPVGRCFAFEPDPLNFAGMVEQFSLNGLERRCQAFRLAVGSEEGRARLFFETPGGAMGHLGAAAHEGEASVDVDVTTLDRLVGKHPPPHFIKMDVEGSEVQVLDGATGLLREVRPTWLIELHGEECMRGATERLRAADYELRDINDEPLGAGPVPRQILAVPR
jgi:FkbM family methyltransferase